MEQISFLPVSDHVHTVLVAFEVQMIVAFRDHFDHTHHGTVVELDLLVAFRLRSDLIPVPMMVVRVEWLVTLIDRDGNRAAIAS